MKVVIRAALAASLSICLFVNLSLAENKVIAKAAIVLDSSASMWGMIGRDVKYDLLRKELVDSLKSEKNLNLNLLTFGHRKQQSCDDVEVLLNDKPSSDLEAAITPLAPRGKAPLIKALKTANEQGIGETDSIILITDGVDTCGVDTCTVIGDIPIHVIPFGIVSAAEQAQLACLAEVTGGEFLPAQNRQALRKALAVVFESTKASAIEATSIVQAANSNVQGSSKTTSNEGTLSRDRRRAPVIEQAVPKGSSNMGAVRLSAVLKFGQSPLEQIEGWKIYSLRSPKAISRTLIATSQDPAADFQLPSGYYMAEATRGLARARGVFKIEAGKKLAEVLELKAGELSLQAALVSGAPALENIDEWKIYRFPSTGETSPKGRKISAPTLAVESFSDQPKLTLPSGEYLVEVKRGHTSAEKQLTIESGSSNEITVLLNAAEIKMVPIGLETFALERDLTASANSQNGNSENGNSETVRWQIFSSELQANGKRLSLGSAFGDSPVLTLPNGDYIAIASLSFRSPRNKETESGKNLTDSKLPDANFTEGKLLEGGVQFSANAGERSQVNVVLE